MLQVQAFSASLSAHAANEWLHNEASRGKAITSITATESVSLDSIGRRRCSYTVWIIYEESAEEQETGQPQSLSSKAYPHRRAGCSL